MGRAGSDWGVLARALGPVGPFEEAEDEDDDFEEEEELDFEDDDDLDFDDDWELGDDFGDEE